MVTSEQFLHVITQSRPRGCARSCELLPLRCNVQPVNVCVLPENMKKALRLALFVCIGCAPLLAQVPTDSPVDVLRHPGWSKGIFFGGGTTVDSSPSGQNFVIGIRVGRVLTNEHGSGIFRGTFELAGD